MVLETDGVEETEGDLTEGVGALRPGGQTSTVMHCWSAPRPPFSLVVTQTVCFSATLSEFSADLSLSAR